MNAPNEYYITKNRHIFLFEKAFLTPRHSRWLDDSHHFMNADQSLQLTTFPSSMLSDSRRPANVLLRILSIWLRASSLSE